MPVRAQGCQPGELWRQDWLACVHLPLRIRSRWRRRSPLGRACKWGWGGQCTQHLHSSGPTAAGACGSLKPFSRLKGRRNWLMN